MIPEFLRSWDQSAVTTTIVLSDRKNPVELEHGLPQHSFMWKRGDISPNIIKALRQAAEVYEADVVLKLDCDAVHNTFDWMREGGDLIGFKHAEVEDSIYGCFYAVTTDTLKNVEASYQEKPPRISREDIMLSLRAKELGLDVKLLPLEGNFVGADDRIFTRPEVFDGTVAIHCGEFGHSPKGRDKAREAMKSFNDYKGR